MTKIQLDRLELLTKHLKEGKLAHPVFDFNYVNVCNVVGKDEEYQANGCGTHGCAYGELPQIWPENFRWNGSLIEKKKDTPGAWLTREMFNLCEDWFGLNHRETATLLHPISSGGGDCYEAVEGLQRLPATATQDEVADNILKFIELKRKAAK